MRLLPARNSGLLLLLVLLRGTAIAGGIDSLGASLPAHLAIDADVDSSAVYIDGLFVGRTPLELDSLAAGSHSLLVLPPRVTSWFGIPDSARISVDSGETRRLSFHVLTAFRHGAATIPANSPLLGELPGQNSRSLEIWASGGLSVVAGIAAAYFKISADEKNDNYLLTGNSALRDERKRLDTASGIAFAVMQVGFAIFSYLLLSE
jgi:hypothetical protein